MFFIVYDVWWVNWILWSCLINEHERCYGCAKFFLSNVHFIKSMQHRPEASQWQGQSWELHQTSEFTEPKGITKQTWIYAGFLSCIWKSGICSWLKRNPPSFGYWKKKNMSNVRLHFFISDSENLEQEFLVSLLLVLHSLSFWVSAVI